MALTTQLPLSLATQQAGFRAELIEPTSGKLEFVPQHFWSDLFNPLTGADLRDYLKDNPQSRIDRATAIATREASIIYGFPDSGSNSDLLRSMTRRGIIEFLGAGRDPSFTVDDMYFPRELEVPASTLREFGRLGAQHIKVYEAVAETGEIPVL